MSPRGDARAALGRLARQVGLETAYVDGVGIRRRVPDDSLVAALDALGVRLDARHDPDAASRLRERAAWRRPIEPVVVVWVPGPGACQVRGPESLLRGRVGCVVELEGGGGPAWTVDLGRCRPTATASIDGRPVVERRLPLPEGLPVGYHTLRVEVAGRRRRALLIVAPVRVHDPDAATWGGFLPAHALRTAESWGLGDFTDLERLVDWLGGLGGGLLSTLPLLATFLGRRPFDPSPYAPVSRLFWNELFVDPRRTPEFAHSAAARALVASTPFGRELAAVNRGRHVDYARVMRLKRRVLEQLADEVDTRDDRRAAAFRRYVRGRHGVDRYATFRAVGERLGRGWPEWPADARRGRVDAADVDPRARRYHAYAQWIAAEQVAALGRHARASGPGLYLDMPIGVHPEGFDVWAHRDLFAHGVAAGAPPDALFTQGQNWGFPPFHPEAIRRDRYRHVRAMVRHVARHAGVVRLDHVMGLHRLYWIPDGCAATDGVYVHYRPDELYAVLAVESHRHRVAIVGENLGTVPAAVNRAMDTHGLRRMYVQQFEIRPGAARPLGRVPRRAVASVNTHDVPTFGAYFRGLDLDTSVTLGWRTRRAATAETRGRARLRGALARALGAARGESDATLLRRCLRRLAASRASLVLVTLEDLWGETEPQNIPGTGPPVPNWRRRARLTFERFRDRLEVVETLREVARLRRRVRL